MTDLDPKLTFDSFVVGPSSRLANAAARRAAESPGTSYNPLFLYSASGLGKSHILSAIAHHCSKNAPDRKVEYLTSEQYLEELADALAQGDRDAFRGKFEDLDILLLDDVQFLAGQPEAQELLLRTLDLLSTSGSQIVLASDRPPADINGLDARLVSRFSGGLIVDIGNPEFETRVAIIRKKAEERGMVLQAGVAESLARYPFRNVRELGGALNKVFATQDLEGRAVTAEEVAALMGSDMTPGDVTPGDVAEGDFGAFLEGLTGAVAETVQAKEPPWRRAFREAMDAAEREGYSAQRLRARESEGEPAEWQRIVEQFRADVHRLREIGQELARLGNPWTEQARDVLREPDRLHEAESLLLSVRERQRPFPELGPGPGLEKLKDYPTIALKAAQQLVAVEKPQYNPLYIWSEPVDRGRTLLGATGRSFHSTNPEARMAVTSAQEFAEDFIRALGEGVAGAWRERWWTLDLLLVHGLEALSETERAQDEFFHLFEALKRRGARVMLVADRPPARIANIDERLRSRFEGGLVLEVEAGAGTGDLNLVESPPPAREMGRLDLGSMAPAVGVIPPLEELEIGEGAGLFPDLHEPSSSQELLDTGEPEGQPSEAVPEVPKRAGAEWFPSVENVVLVWPRLEDLLQEELD
jgi:chromosomal replication initiator protein